MNNSKGEPTPITVEVPNQTEGLWEIPNMSGNWNCNVDRYDTPHIDITGFSSINVHCYEDGEYKVLFRLECSEVKRTNEVLIGFLDGSYLQTMSFSCEY